MLAIHFNDTRQLFVTEEEKKRDKLCWLSSFRKKIKRKIISICLSCSFPIPLSSSVSCQGQNDVIHRLFNWNCTQPNHRAAAPLEVNGKIPTAFYRRSLVYQWGEKSTTSTWVIQTRGRLHLWNHALVHVPWCVTGSCIAADLAVPSVSFQSLKSCPRDFIVKFWCLT